MVGWMTLHPWMTLFLGLAAIDGIRAVLSPSCPPCVQPATMTSGKLIPFVTLPTIRVPRGNGVYHGLVRA